MKLSLFKFAVLLMVAHISVSQETDAEKDIVLKKNENAQETAKIETNNAAETEQPDQDFKPAEDISEDYPVPLPSDI